MSEIKTPKFVEDFANYLVAIRNLSQVYIKNMTVTIEQFLEFIKNIQTATCLLQE